MGCAQPALPRPSRFGSPTIPPGRGRPAGPHFRAPASRDQVSTRRDGSRVRDSEAVLALRRELGVRLKALRLAAGYTQPQLARTTGYSRSTISTVEGGGQNVPLTFWERCDQVLETGGALTAEFGRVEGQRDAERRELARREAAARAGALRAVHLAGPGQLGPGPHALSLADAATAYQDVGWPVEQTGGRLVLVTGDGVDALEAPRAAGVLAVRWWLFTGGAQDGVPGLPALPPPAALLAACTAGARYRVRGCA